MKSVIKNVSLVPLRTFSDRRGNLSVAEIKKELPFLVKRIFYIHNLKPAAERACHATKKQEEVLFCLNGSFSITVDDGLNQKTFRLTGPEQGLHIGRYVWRRLFDFSKGCIVLALSNVEYMPDDHITDYQDFLKAVRKIK